MSKKKRNTQEKNQRVNRLMAYQKEINAYRSRDVRSITQEGGNSL